jgi:hypothetical protein
MQHQNYSNHRRYYAPHHFIFYPVAAALLILALYFADKYTDDKTGFYLLATVIFLVIWLSFMLRQHYALLLQNRIVRLEMRVRYFQMSGKRFEPVEQKLNFNQIAALRFASDSELPALVDRALKENLSPDDIKKSIISWQPDHMRV